MTVNRIMPGRLALNQAVPAVGQTNVVPVVDPAAAQRSADAAAVARAQNTAALNALVSYGVDSVVDLTNYIVNPADVTFPVVTPIQLLNFRVPIGLVLVVKKIGVTYSNPVVAMTQTVGWRVIVNGHRVPWIFQTTDDYFYTSYGTVSQPLEVEPLVVQSGSLLALEVYPRFAFANALTVSGRFSGKLLKPATPDATGI